MKTFPLPASGACLTAGDSEAAALVPFEVPDDCFDLCTSLSGKSAAFDTLSELACAYAGECEKAAAVCAFMNDENSRLCDYFYAGRQNNYHASNYGLREMFKLEHARKVLNSKYWDLLLKKTDVLELMPEARRSEWHTQIEKLSTPDFDESTARSTIENLLALRPKFLAERVDGLFRSLSGKHITNSPAGFGAKMIIENGVSEFRSVNSRACGVVHDLRCVVAKFMGRDTPNYSHTNRNFTEIIAKMGEWTSLDGGALRVKTFKKGTIHIEVHPQMAWRLNAVLASLYPNAIASANRTKPAAVPKEFGVLSRALSFEAISILDTARPRKQGENHFCLNLYRLEEHPAARMEEARSILNMLGGIEVRPDFFEFDYDPTKVLAEISLTGVIPDHVSHQFYPTKETLVRRMLDEAEIDNDGQDCQVLEPSAGQGGIASFLPLESTTCVEISPVFARVLAAKGLRVVEGDFLKLAHDASLENAAGGTTFDRVLMNPPFSEGRAALHVKAAAELLSSGGILVAVVPASLRGKTLLGAGYTESFSEVIQDAFDGTSVSVCLLKARKIG